MKPATIRRRRSKPEADLFPDTIKGKRSAKPKGLDPHETPIHIAIYQYLLAVLPPKHARVWHTPNGGVRDKAEAGKLGRMGVLPGVADLIIMTPHRRLFFLEVKTKTGRLSTAQREFRDFCQIVGFPFGVVRSVEDARAFLKENCIQTRETKPYHDPARPMDF